MAKYTVPLVQKVVFLDFIWLGFLDFNPRLQN
jgi:hypothetical protein